MGTGGAVARGEADRGAQGEQGVAMKESDVTTSEPFPVPTDLRSEEDVKIKFLVPFLQHKGYESRCIDFNKPIEIQEGRKQKTIFADAVVYTTAAKTAPLIVCETKPPNEGLTNRDKGQAISYARLLDRIAPLVLVTNGAQTRVFQSLSKSRIAELPHRKDLREDFVKFVVSAEMREALRTEAKHELFIIDDVQSFKVILRACHDEIRNNEGYDATKSFDELSKVLFCKMYEEKNHPEDSNRFRTLIFDDSSSKLGVNVVTQIWNETKNDPRFVGLFEPKSVIDLQDRTIRKIVSLFEDYDLSLTAFDVKGEAFEYFLGETFTGGLGQYFTPRNVVEFMVDAVDPKIGQKIVDEFCGTGGFLIYAFEVVSEKIRLQEFSEDEKEKWKTELSNRSLFGTDWAERTALACKMNMIVHGDGSAGISLHHGLTDVPGKIEKGGFDLCITNPPFGSIENDPAILRQYDLGKGRKSQERSILAIERGLQLVKPAGIVAIVVIDGILNNDSKAYVRDYIRKTAWVRGIISLPAVTFEGYNSRAKTSILFLEKKKVTPDETGEQQPTFMAVAENTGYAPNGMAVPGNELPEVLLDYKAFTRGKESHISPRTWVARLLERMDAEFYRPRPMPERPNHKQVASLANTATDALKQMAQELTAVQSDLQRVFTGLDVVQVPLKELIEPVKNIVRVDRAQSYRLLGVRWWGEGTFLREGKTGKDIKATKLNQVSAGWLIYNRLFAFRGSFAVVTKEDDGGFVSGEFPTFRMRDGVENPEFVSAYVIHCFNSPQYLTEVDRASTGSTKTSRNRYKENHFLATRVAIPRSSTQLTLIVDLLDRASHLRRQNEAVLQQIKNLNDGIALMLPSPS